MLVILCLDGSAFKNKKLKLLGLLLHCLPISFEAFSEKFLNQSLWRRNMHELFIEDLIAEQNQNIDQVMFSGCPYIKWMDQPWYFFYLEYLCILIFSFLISDYWSDKVASSTFKLPLMYVVEPVSPLGNFFNCIAPLLRDTPDQAYRWDTAL